MHGSLMNKKVFCLLLICLFVSIVGLTFHHHKDGATHENCAACIYLSHHASFLVHETPQISAPTFNILHIPLESTFHLSFLHCSPYWNRAPPSC
jgi:hypothetical protein